MKLYFSIFKTKFINNITYRAAAIAGILTQAFFAFMYIFVYIAFYESGSPNLDLNLSQVVSYLWLNQAFYFLTYIMIVEKDFIKLIRTGDIAYELCRPIKFFKKWYASLYGQRIAGVSLRFMPIIILAMILPSPYKLMVPSSIVSFLVFILSLVLSSFLVTAIAYIFHILTFFTLDGKGILVIFTLIGEIFSGGVVPIALFPGVLKQIAYILPFRYICDLPFNIYVGYTSPVEGLQLLLAEVLWLIAFIILGNILTNKALRRAVVQGG